MSDVKNRISMKVLEQEYKAKGQRDYFYRIVKREGDVVMASMHKESTGELWGYEVFLVKKYPARMSPDGKTKIEAAEAPPPSSMWGRNAYSLYATPQGRFRAEAYFWEMTEIQKEEGKVDKKGRVKKRSVREENVERLYKEHLEQLKLQ
jgi:hypothetical protein